MIDKKSRSKALGQKPCVIWLTGLSGAGKTSIANRLEQLLTNRGNHCYILDGDDIRHGLSADLGFSEYDRSKNIGRVAEVAKLFADAGLIAIVALISPFQRDREVARRIVGVSDFVEVYVNTPISICESRDAKGFYRKARIGELADFTGVDSPYEPPTNPEIELLFDNQSVDQLADEVMCYLVDTLYL